MTQALDLASLSDLLEQLGAGCSLEEAEGLFGTARMAGLSVSGLVKAYRGTGFVDCTECGEQHSEPTRFDEKARRWYWICRTEKHYLPASASQVVQLDLSALLLSLQRILGLSDASRLPPDPVPETAVLLGSVQDPDRTIFLSFGVKTTDSLVSVFTSAGRGSKHGGWILTLGPAPNLDPPRQHKWLDVDELIVIDGAGELRLVQPLPWTAGSPPVATRDDRHAAMWAIFHERGPGRLLDRGRRLGAEAQSISDQMPDHLKLQPGTVANLIGNAFWAEKEDSHEDSHD